MDGLDERLLALPSSGSLRKACGTPYAPAIDSKTLQDRFHTLYKVCVVRKEFTCMTAFHSLISPQALAGWSLPVLKYWLRVPRSVALISD